MHDSASSVSSKACSFSKLWMCKTSYAGPRFTKSVPPHPLPVLGLPFKLLKLLIRATTTAQGLGLLNTMISQA